MGSRRMPFEREIEAKDEKEAKERILTLLGGEHGCKRHQIEIKEVVKNA